MKVKKAVIPAAGYGTRFLPASKAQPKEMIPVVDKPTIQYIVEEAVAAGIEEILIISSKDKQSIEDHFDKSMALESYLEKKGKMDLLDMVRDISELADIHYIRQGEQKGLGHAIFCARTFVGDDPFAVLLGDDLVDAAQPVIGQMIEIFEDKNEPIIGVQKVAREDVSKYGIVKYSEQENSLYQVEDLIEKPDIKEAPSNLAILGRYVITPDIFPLLAETKPGKGNEIQLTDALKSLAEKRTVQAYDFIGKRYDVGNKFGYLQATVELALKYSDYKEEFKDYLKKYINTQL